MTIPEPARALGWHLARAAVCILGGGVVLAYGALFILATGYAITGNLPWWIPAALLAGLTLPVGAVTWWRAGMVRPGTIPASDVLRGHLTADIRRANP